MNDKLILNKEQYQAVYHYKGPMLVLAGPGSGKTKVLTERIKILIEKYNVKPEEILVITFSKKAALEMQNRFKKIIGYNHYPVNFGTFHAIFFNLLRVYKGYNKENILTEKEKREYLAEIAINNNIENGSSLAWQENMLYKISQRKNLGEKVFDEKELCLLDEEEREEFVKVYNYYIQKCDREKKLDFDDMIILCRKILYQHESILRMVKEHYKYILVDEFQDINDAQYEVLRLIAGDDKNVFCVGDDDQSIYAFRGAKPELMTKFLKQFPNCKQINLLTNYRCCNNIVEAANTVINHNLDRISRPKQNVFNNKESGKVYIINSESSLIQANVVCEEIIRLKKSDNYKFSDFAIIYRSSHCAKMLEITCENLNIPTEINRDLFNIFSIKEIRIIVSYFRISLGVGKKSDFFLIINNPPRNITRESLNNINDKYMENMYNFYSQDMDKINALNNLKKTFLFVKSLPPIAGLIYMLYGTNLYNYFKKNFKINSHNYSLDEIIDIFKDIAREFDTIQSLLEFIDNLNESGAKVEKNGNDSVHLITAHASKGLEYKVVFVIGLQEGLFPHNKNLHGKSVEEERRLMYVAMTRAKQILYLCSISSEHGKLQSRFISEIYDNPNYHSFISSNSSLSRNSSNASATASYSSSSAI